MSYTIRKQLFGWFLTFEYDPMGNLPLWGTLKNNKRTLKNGPKYAKNLEMPWNSFAKRCWQPCFTLQKSTFNLKRHQNIKVWKIPAGDMKSIESGFGFSLELQGCGSPKNCFEICGPRPIICENFKSKALIIVKILILKNFIFHRIQVCWNTWTLDLWSE